MSKDNRLYTFLIAPTPSSKVRQFSFHRSLVYLVGGFFAVLFLLTAYGAVRLGQTEALSLRNATLKAENRKLKEENDAYQNSYSKLKEQISYIGDMSKELARQARMDHTPDIDQQIGIGGPVTVAALDKTADHLESRMRHINDRLRSDFLRLSSIPSGLPVNGYVSDGFGIRHNPFSGEGRETHEGMDIAVDFGTPVSSTADGLVIHAGPYSGYGNLVILYHSNGVTTRYGHLSRITVEAGQRVKRGDQIGHAGSTGRSTGVHVHYEIRENDQPVDPARYIPSPQP
ncbi:MAG TPA: M23 family metallopeptidase [Blastocatellia bacterium]|nr:M23 family metallopeptidase [Blastocatellia bacterium]